MLGMYLREFFEGLLTERDVGVVFGSLICMVLMMVLLRLWLREKKRLQESEEQRMLLEGGEHRMFEFLHTLGAALEEDHSAAKLNREIVDGVCDVVGARGGAIYLLDRKRGFLLPKYLSKKCPPLIGLPVEVLEQLKGDRQALQSHVKLSKVQADEGMLGSVLGGGFPVWVKDLKNHDAFRDAFVLYEGDVSALAAPLSYGGRDLGVLVAARSHEDGQYSKGDFELFRSAAEQAAFALGNAMIHREAGEKRKMESELRTARDVQSVLLPSEQPQIPGWRVEGMNKPARIISGDYYDYIPMGDGKWAVVIADVSGKGVAAGLLMAMCRSVLRAELERDNDPVRVLDKVNRLLFPDIREDSFISLALYVIDEVSGKIQLVRAGHDKAPLLRQGADEVEWVKPPGLAIGLDDGDVFARVTKSYEFEMGAGDCLLIYTDGVTEAENQAEEEFGVERMVESLRKGALLGAEEIVRELMKDMNDFTKGVRQMDDVTVIALEKR